MVGILLTAIVLIAQWFMFKKMGRQGWEGIIPLYNTYILFEVLYGNGVKMFTLLIPIYNIYVIIMLNIDLAHAFNQSTGFAFGLILLSPVFYCIIAFSNSIQFMDGTNQVNTVDDIKGIFK